jgi:glycosyltransferase involved in cell wall biosynthesis
MKQHTHVTFVSDYLSIYTGGPLIMASIFEGLVKRYNYDITIVTGLVDEAFREKFENTFNIVDLKIFQPGKLPHQQPGKIPSFLLKARNTILSSNSDILHFNSHTPNLIPYSISVKKPVVCTIHHLENFSAVSSFVSKFLLPVSQDILEVNTICTLIHVTSKYTAEQVAKRRFFARRRIIMIPNGIDLSKHLAVKKKPEPGTFLMIGRLEPRKHYEHAILAAKLARKHRKDLKLYIVGDGPLRPALERKIREENLEDAVKLLGNVDEQEKLELLARSEALIHLGYPEGFGIVVIEALAMGIPVISYNLPPINEIIKNNVHGILLNKDDIASLARVLIHFRAQNFNPDVLRAKATEYDLEQTARKFHKLYSVLLNEP